MKKVKISLVIPAFNEEKYIGSCLDYAIKNSNGNFFEIIAVDNASSDRTSLIASSKGVKVVREEQKGLTKARQRGFEEATGEIVAYVDADTHMPSGWCEKIISEFEKNPNLACLSGPYAYYDASYLKQLGVKLYWYFLALPAYCFTGYMAVGGNFAIRRDVLKKMGGFDTAISFYGEDTDIARRAHAFGKVKFLPSFVMHTSFRRLAREGILKIAALYVLNFLSEVFLHKPITEKYKDIR